ncbi:GLPGLI family protein [Sinomicrobium weinanense]|uniref:GLPGLI family protein n=1 Tax=Sinomicrobium weinanense TaxID=2842200 RepID=A0A926Q0H7_9FLAO|nr:GLPGLI family protein [Sinomicrobium weinanense]MBC9794932.1 GLPGLI family protein [Sinomicrobium weinanense]MBU3125703.1 GLPGLI family protein [Sinomicrobium weinanense]
MKKIILLSGVFLIGVLSPVVAQDLRGKAIYESKTDLDMDFGGEDIPEQDKKRMAERMKQSLEKTFVLDFNRTASLYKEEEQLEPPAGGSGMRMMVFGGPGGDGTYYKDVREKLYYNQVEMFGKIFLVRDTLPEQHWKLENETRKIGEYTCYKATTVKKVRRREFGRTRRDGKEKTKDTMNNTPVEKTKEIVITAWYTPDIPVNQGPGEYWGLPGLILEINADRTTILCSKIVMSSKAEDKIEVPKKGKQVNQAEFDEIMRKKAEEIREMHRGDRRGRKGNRVFRIGG